MTIEYTSESISLLSFMKVSNFVFVFLAFNTFYWLKFLKYFMVKIIYKMSECSTSKKESSAKASCNEVKLSVYHGNNKLTLQCDIYVSVSFEGIQIVMGPAILWPTLINRHHSVMNSVKQNSSLPSRPKY